MTAPSTHDEIQGWLVRVVVRGTSDSVSTPAEDPLLAGALAPLAEVDQPLAGLGHRESFAPIFFFPRFRCFSIFAASHPSNRLWARAATEPVPRARADERIVSTSAGQLSLIWISPKSGEADIRFLSGATGQDAREGRRNKRARSGRPGPPASDCSIPFRSRASSSPNRCRGGLAHR